MYIEYYNNSIDEKDIDIKNTIDSMSVISSVRNITTTLPYAKFIKKNFSQYNVGAFIDYPIPSCDIKGRVEAAKTALEFNLNYICVTVPSYYIANRKYDKFREDIKQLSGVYPQANIRYVLEYRKFDHNITAKVCEILMSLGITTCYPATGFFLDSLDDNIIACQYLYQKTSINTIINGNVWTQEQIQKVLNSNLYGLSTTNTHIIKQF